VQGPAACHNPKENSARRPRRSCAGNDGEKQYAKIRKQPSQHTKSKNVNWDNSQVLWALAAYAREVALGRRHELGNDQPKLDRQREASAWKNDPNLLSDERTRAIVRQRHPQKLLLNIALD